MLNSINVVGYVQDHVQFGQAGNGAQTARSSVKLTRIDKNGQEKVDAFIGIDGYGDFSCGQFQGVQPGHLVAVSGRVNTYKTQQGVERVSISVDKLTILPAAPQAPQQQGGYQQQPAPQQGYPPQQGAPAQPQQGYAPPTVPQPQQPAPQAYGPTAQVPF